MLDPDSDMPPLPSSPTISSSDLDTESTGSFFHDRSTTLGTLMGVSFPAVAFRAPSRHHSETQPANAASASAAVAKPKKRRALTAAFGAERLGRRRRKWWQICRDGDSKPASLGEFLEVGRRFGDGAFYGAAAELRGMDGRCFPTGGCCLLRRRLMKMKMHPLPGLFVCSRCRSRGYVAVALDKVYPF